MGVRSKLRPSWVPSRSQWPPFPRRPCTWGKRHYLAGTRGEQEQARINAELVRQVQEANQRTEQANQRAQEAIAQALASAEAQKRAEVLARQLQVSEGLKQSNFEGMQKAQGQVNTVAMRLAGGKQCRRRSWTKATACSMKPQSGYVLAGSS